MGPNAPGSGGGALEPDDKLVLSFRQQLSSEAIEHVKAIASEAFDGAQKRVIVLHGGATMGVLRQTRQGARCAPRGHDERALALQVCDDIAQLLECGSDWRIVIANVRASVEQLRPKGPD